ncbi:hypothetical protein CEXT_48441 [Caerostris extrusa]|uniref:Uncharacterized protein n=1 Tax=Caerostris extrusa TaxID=172846 RepID=A0AAV4N0Q1_CAEEX|nr:hypothetical protein CEXT_48441 [Caerostris extrusa]
MRETDEKAAIFFCHRFRAFGFLRDLMAPEPLAQLFALERSIATAVRRGKHGASGAQGAALPGQLSHLRSMPNGPAEVEIFKLIDPFRFLTDWIVSPLLPRLADSHLRGMSSAFNYLRPLPLLSLPYHPLRSIPDCRQAVNTELLSGVGVEVVSIH